MFRLIIITLTLINMTAIAQTNIQNVSLTNPDSNILYIGVDNIIKVVGLDTDTTIKLVSTTGKISKWSGKFILRHTFAKSDTLWVYSSNNKILSSKVYDIKVIGNPVARLGHITDTITTVQEILTDTKINVVIPDCYYDHHFRVISFSVSVTNNIGDQILKQENILNNQLPDKFSKKINKLKSGDRIILSEITATCPDCALRRLNDITLTIK